MPTSNYGFPYPLLSDPPNGPQGFKDLADAVDSTLLAKVNALQTQIDTLSARPVTPTFAGERAMPGVSALNSAVSYAVTFPVGRFATPPFVVTSPQSSSPHQWATGCGDPTTAGVTIYASKTSGAASGSTTVHYIASA